jgi:hypothetical protein
MKWKQFLNLLVGLKFLMRELKLQVTPMEIINTKDILSDVWIYEHRDRG